jgi:L-lactate dehydrogenase complex protein LldE
MVTHHYKDFIGSELEAWKELKSKVYELSEFLIDVLNITELDASFPHRVGLHQSCHGLRELRLGAGSERHVEPMSKTRACLEMVKDIELVELKRDDECCGFGGTFAVAEEDVSCSMGRDRLDDHQQAGAEVVAGGDVSCMMHMEGLSKRENRSFKFMHFAEILMGEST